MGWGSPLSVFRNGGAKTISDTEIVAKSDADFAGHRRARWIAEICVRFRRGMCVTFRVPYTANAVVCTTVLSAKEECICRTPGRRDRYWR
jgi:hypothetical protein